MAIKRVLIKISGEALSGADCIFDSEKVSKVCANIKNLLDTGVAVSIVIGGGNIIRGRSAFLDIGRETADNMGMIATSINGLMIQEMLCKIGVESVVLSSVSMPFGIEQTSLPKINQCINNNSVIIFVAGTGVPYFSTDTSAVIYSIMTKSDVLLKATKTDGVYNKDPEKFADVVHIEKISHSETISMGIEVMDKTAFIMAMQKKLKIVVFSIYEDNCFVGAINGSIRHSVIF